MRPRAKCVMCLLLCVSIAFSGCAGRQANPIPTYLPGDENRSCEAYRKEIDQLEEDMDRILPHTNKLGYNTVMVAGGVFFLVPFFFMDLKNAEKVEWEAMRVRRNRLLVYAQEKGCDLGPLERTPIPSLEEMKRMAKVKGQGSQSVKTTAGDVTATPSGNVAKDKAIQVDMASKGTTQNLTTSPALPAPAVFVIKDARFRADYKEDLGADLKIIGVHGDRFTVNPTKLALINGELASPWCHGSKHTWIGKLTYAGYTFDSDANDPLQFMVDKDQGYVYLRGTGVVTSRDGTITKLPPASLTSPAVKVDTKQESTGSPLSVAKNEAIPSQETQRDVTTLAPSRGETKQRNGSTLTPKSVLGQDGPAQHVVTPAPIPANPPTPAATAPVEGSLPRGDQTEKQTVKIRILAPEQKVKITRCDGATKAFPSREETAPSNHHWVIANITPNGLFCFSGMKLEVLKLLDNGGNAYSAVAVADKPDDYYAAEAIINSVQGSDDFLFAVPVDAEILAVEIPTGARLAIAPGGEGLSRPATARARKGVTDAEATVASTPRSAAEVRQMVLEELAKQGMDSKDQEAEANRRLQARESLATAVKNLSPNQAIIVFGTRANVGELTWIGMAPDRCKSIRLGPGALRFVKPGTLLSFPRLVGMAVAYLGTIGATGDAGPTKVYYTVHDAGRIIFPTSYDVVTLWHASGSEPRLPFALFGERPFMSRTAISDYADIGWPEFQTAEGVSLPAEPGKVCVYGTLNAINMLFKWDSKDPILAAWISREFSDISELFAQPVLLPDRD